MTLDQQPGFRAGCPRIERTRDGRGGTAAGDTADSLRPDAKSVDTPIGNDALPIPGSSDEWQDDLSDTFRTGWMAACGIPDRDSYENRIDEDMRDSRRKRPGFQQWRSGPFCGDQKPLAGT